MKFCISFNTIAAPVLFVFAGKWAAADWRASAIAALVGLGCYVAALRDIGKANQPTAGVTTARPVPDSVEHYGLIDERSPQGQAQAAALGVGEDCYQVPCTKGTHGS